MCCFVPAKHEFSKTADPVICVIACAYYNNDGILGIRTKQPKTCFAAQRLYYTESGHYMLSVSRFDKIGNYTLDKAIAFESKSLGNAAQEQLGSVEHETALVVFEADLSAQVFSKS